MEIDGEKTTPRAGAYESIGVATCAVTVLTVRESELRASIKEPRLLTTLSLRPPRSKFLPTFVVSKLLNIYKKQKLQLRAVDHSARGSMKNAAKRDS